MLRSLALVVRSLCLTVAGSPVHQPRPLAARRTTGQLGRRASAPTSLAGRATETRSPGEKVAAGATWQPAWRACRLQAAARSWQLAVEQLALERKGRRHCVGQLIGRSPGWKGAPGGAAEIGLGGERARPFRLAAQVWAAQVWALPDQWGGVGEFVTWWSW